MEKMNVEASEIQYIDTIEASSIVTCIDKCRFLFEQTNDTETGLDPGDTDSSPPEVSPSHCNTLSYDTDSETCELAFITDTTKWASRNAGPSDTTKSVFVRVPSNVGPPSTDSPPVTANSLNEDK